MSVFTNPASSSREQGRAYTAAILGLLGERDPLDVLRDTESVLRASIDGLTSDQLSTPEAPGKWSIAQVLRHLADSEIVWGWRLRMAFAHDRPPITGYDQDAWAERLGYEAEAAEDSLREFAAIRGGHLRLLGRASPADLRRAVVHAERGEESIAHMMKLYAGHDLLHRAQVQRIRSALR